MPETNEPTNEPIEPTTEQVETDSDNDVEAHGESVRPLQEMGDEGISAPEAASTLSLAICA
jgi:hypothetical protein